jgi:hypothetical protein
LPDRVARNRQGLGHPALGLFQGSALAKPVIGQQYRSKPNQLQGERSATPFCLDRHHQWANFPEIEGLER